MPGKVGRSIRYKTPIEPGLRRFEDMLPMSHHASKECSGPSKFDELLVCDNDGGFPASREQDIQPVEHCQEARLRARPYNGDNNIVGFISFRCQ